MYRWDAEARPVWYNDPDAQPYTAEEKRDWARRHEQQRREQHDKHLRAEIKGQALIKTARADRHNYFDYKGLPNAQGLVDIDGNLLVPMRHILSNRLQGVQVISWDGEAMVYHKKMIYGMRAADAVFRLGHKRASATILCEGYATGLSIELAARLVRIQASVVICFSAGNLERVAKHCPRALVFADHDGSGRGEQAARATGLRWCMSDKVGNDANDDHEQFGLMAVSKKIHQALHKMD